MPVVFWYYLLIFLLFTICSLPPAFHYAVCKSKKDREKPTIGFSPELTVLLPVKNEALLINRKIEEILSTEYPLNKIRLLIVDSNSTDKTLEIAKKSLNSKNQLLEITFHSVNEPGKSRAVNVALDKIKTDFFIMMDTDCILKKDSIPKIMDNFVNENIGAVCGSQDTSKSSSADSYRIRFNRIRIGESIIDSTPIFEGSICAFRTKSIGDQRLDPNINADDSQLAIIVRKAGFKAIMDGSVKFIDIQPNSRKRSLRRSQGLFRVFMKNLDLMSNYEKYSSIYRQNLYFYVIYSWVVITFFSLAFASTVISFMIENDETHFSILQLLLFFSILIPRTSRGLLVGSSIMVESQLRLFIGDRMQIWEPSREDNE